MIKLLIGLLYCMPNIFFFGKVEKRVEKVQKVVPATFSALRTISTFLPIFQKTDCLII
ncbi:MAG: hypothetical protein ACI8X3_001964 [Saprospiraceae bacterium]|jgi:hypothetical protein